MKQRSESRDRASAEGGFTLIEVIVAMFITLLVMTALLYGVVSSLKTIQQARERQTATAFATQQLERLRALPYDSVTQPNLAYPISTGLPYVTTAGGVSTFAPTGVLPGVSETLVVNQYSGKSQNLTSGSTTYRVRTYVTRSPSVTTSQAYNLYAVVSWTSNVFPGGRSVAQQSTAFAGSGCLSTATSPFSAPCQTYYTAQAGDSGASVTITGVDSTLPIPGLDAQKVTLALPSSTTNLLGEQTMTGTARAVTSGAQVEGATPSVTGSRSALSSVDSDPSSAENQSVTTAAPPQSSSTLTVSGAAGTLSVRPWNADTGSSRAAVAADGTICTGVAGTGLTTGAAGVLRPCASTTVTPSGASAGVEFTGTIGPVLSLASFAAPSSPTRSVAAVLAASNVGACTGATIDCAHAEATRSLGAVVVAGQSPSGSPGSAPAGFNPSWGLLSVSGITESVRAEEGAGRTAPTRTVAGTLHVWDPAQPTKYRTIDLATYTGAAAPPTTTITIDPVTIEYAAGVSVTYEGKVLVQPDTVSSKPVTRTGNPVTDCKAEACEARVDGAGMVIGSLQVTVNVGAESTTFVMVTDLGGLVANASYKVAANA